MRLLILEWLRHYAIYQAYCSIMYIPIFRAIERKVVKQCFTVKGTNTIQMCRVDLWIKLIDCFHSER